MDITAIAPWFGSKRTLAPRIVRQLGPHRCYWEPFCGSLACLLAKPACSQETVNDLHGDLVNLARVLRDSTWGPWLYRQLRRTLVQEDLYRAAAERMKREGAWAVCPNDDDPGPQDAERAYDFFVVSWLGRNGVIGTANYNNNFCVRYTVNGGSQGTRFASAVRSIPQWRKRIAKVTILRRDGLELLERIEDQADVAIYCDPPYLLTTRSSGRSQGAKAGSGRYVHEFAANDHSRLAELLGRFRTARVVVSYYAHPDLATLYPGWSVVQCTVAKALAVQGWRGSTKMDAPEVLLVNGPVFGGEVGGNGDLFGHNGEASSGA